MIKKKKKNPHDLEIPGSIFAGPEIFLKLFS